MLDGIAGSGRGQPRLGRSPSLPGLPPLKCADRAEILHPGRPKKRRRRRVEKEPRSLGFPGGIRPGGGRLRPIRHGGHHRGGGWTPPRRAADTTAAGAETTTAEGTETTTAEGAATTTGESAGGDVTFWTSHTAGTDISAFQQIVDDQRPGRSAGRVGPGHRGRDRRHPVDHRGAGGTGPDVYMLDRFTVAARLGRPARGPDPVQR